MDEATERAKLAAEQRAARKQEGAALEKQGGPIRAWRVTPVRDPAPGNAIEAVLRKQFNSRLLGPEGGVLIFRNELPTLAREIESALSALECAGSTREQVEDAILEKIIDYRFPNALAIDLPVLEHLKREAKDYAEGALALSALDARAAFRAGWYVNATKEQSADYLAGCEEVDWQKYLKTACSGALDPAEKSPPATSDLD